MIFRLFSDKIHRKKLFFFFVTNKTINFSNKIANTQKDNYETINFTYVGLFNSRVYTSTGE